MCPSQLPSAALNREVLTVVPTNLHLPDSSEAIVPYVQSFRWGISFCDNLSNAVVKEHVHINTMCNNITHSFRLIETHSG